MKYALTLNFETKEDLIKFLGDDDHSAASSKTVSANAAPKGRGRAVAAAVEAPVAIQEAPAVVAPPVAIPAPAVMPAPVPQALPQQAAPQAQAPFDRNMVIANINATINEKTSKGVQPAAVAQVCANIFAKIGIAVGTKIGQLDDQSLYNFNGHFMNDIQALQPMVQNNFI